MSFKIDKTIGKNMATILAELLVAPRDSMGNSTMTGPELQEKTELSPVEINDAVTVTVESGYAEWLRTLGTAPFIFKEVSITPRGRYLLENAEEERTEPEMTGTGISVPPPPVGSPYGFTGADWKIVVETKAQSDRLRVVFGFQFDSRYYNTEKLKKNVEKMFEKAVNDYKNLPNSIPAMLDFQSLAAGYGEHLFNEIARNIISADIAVFDTSDRNSNVMVEMGVALTWGVSVFPIKATGCRKPPSDISGQTWADYKYSGDEFVDPDHDNKLLRMVERAIRKK